MPQILQEEFITLQPKGVFTIPKKFRKILGFTDRSVIRVKPEKGRLIIESVRILPYPVRTYSEKEVAEFIDLDKKQTKELKRKGILS